MGALASGRPQRRPACGAKHHGGGGLGQPRADAIEAGRSRARRWRPLPACTRPTTPQPAANAGAASPPPQLHAAGRQRTGGREQRRADGELCAVAMEAGETEQTASARAREAPAKPAPREGARVRRRQACGKRVCGKRVDVGPRRRRRSATRGAGSVAIGTDWAWRGRRRAVEGAKVSPA